MNVIYKRNMNGKENMKKRFVSLLPIFVAVLMVLSGCGKEQEPISEPEEQLPQKIRIYTYDANFAQTMDYVAEKYPEFKEKAEYINISEESFCADMSAMLENEDDVYPDIIVAPFKDITCLVDSSHTLSMSELGITEGDCSQMYPYAMQAVTDKEGNLKALTTEVHPGAFIYRKELAKELLGSSDAKEVQSYMRDWETFTDTARAIYKKSEGQTQMLASSHAIDKAFASGRDKTWQNNEELQMSKHYDKYLDTRYALEKGKFVLTYEPGSSEYFKAASGNKVFGYFVESDFFETSNMGKPGYEGDWGICEGPEAYFVGGCWIFVTDRCCEKELVGDALNMLCTDMATLEKIRSDRKSFVNNIKVMSNAMNTGKGSSKFLGGNDFIDVLSKQAQNIEYEFGGPKDEELNTLFFGLSDKYMNDTLDKEKLAEELKSEADAILHPVVTEEVSSEAKPEE